MILLFPCSESLVVSYSCQRTSHLWGLFSFKTFLNVVPTNLSKLIFQELHLPGPFQWLKHLKSWSKEREDEEIPPSSATGWSWTKPCPDFPVLGEGTLGHPNKPPQTSAFSRLEARGVPIPSLYWKMPGHQCLWIQRCRRSYPSWICFLVSIWEAQPNTEKVPIRGSHTI